MTREPFIAHSELTNEIYIVSGGEHLKVDADDMTICDDFIKVHRDKDGNQIFMNIYKRDLMAWEVVR